MFRKGSSSLSRALALALLALLPAALAAQAVPSVKANPSDGSPSKWDIFAGYSFLSPHGTFNTLQPGVVGTPVGSAFAAFKPEDGGTPAVTIPVQFKSENSGALGSLAYFFNKNSGVQVEFGVHDPGVDSGLDNSGKGNGAIYTIGAGFIFRFPLKNATPFVHAVVGGSNVHGPDYEPATWGPVITAGGGLDLNTPWFNHRLGIRVIQADYEYIHADSGTSHYSGNTFVYGDQETLNSARLSAGIVYHIGSIAPPPQISLTCSANPSWVYPGDPVTVTATAGNVEPKANVIYTWAGNGVTGNGSTATVATGALAAGTYTVNCGVKEGKPGKEGLRCCETANSTASFTVKAFEPPTISCSANPGTIMPGQTSRITSVGVSPQNRPLTYSYSTTAGTIEGSGSQVTFNSGSAPTGAVGITCAVSDDKGQMATANTGVTITAPYVPPPPTVKALCAGPIAFGRDKRRPARVDNEAKACLDQVANALKSDSTATAVVVGEATTLEKTPKKGKHAKFEDLAAERAVNTKDYLVNEEQSGIDASRISVRTGNTDAQQVENYLVPAGANFDADVPGTKPVDETAVKKLTRKPIPDVLPAPKKHKKHAPRPVAPPPPPPPPPAAGPGIKPPQS